MKIIFLLLTFISFVSAQQPQWQRGIGTAVGTDIEAIRMKALNNAARMLLQKPGSR